MISCEEALELINAKVDGEASVQEQQILEEHLTVCADCRALLADVTQIHTEMPLLNAPVPPTLSKDVMERIRTEKIVPMVSATHAARSRRWKSWAATAAVFGVVLLGAGTFGLEHFFAGNNPTSPSTGASAGAAPADSSSPTTYGLDEDNSVAEKYSEPTNSPGSERIASPESGTGVDNTPHERLAVVPSASVSTSPPAESHTPATSSPDTALMSLTPPPDSDSRVVAAEIMTQQKALDAVYTAIGGDRLWSKTALTNRSLPGYALTAVEKSASQYAALIAVVSSDDASTFQFHLHTYSSAARTLESRNAAYTCYTVAASDGTITQTTALSSEASSPDLGNQNETDSFTPPCTVCDTINN